ncbi:permease prefix domain 1-containing protein [Oscillibacter sp.]|uniref:permease prefix domain 1-containing protein n=1 Tax=Oscillibacter sp. TaxID=1945593 RepID=UPI002D7FE55C|nr:permease prefix domain 1-containing protein [Oscillibacter sp.]
MRDAFQIWVDAVCEQVRFRPDRKAIAAELRVHYDDHVKDLLRLGRPWELAQERALAAMGNAQEVGRALDRVHKPWLGWLWEASRVLLALALAAALVHWGLFYYAAVSAQNQFSWTEPPPGASHAAMDDMDLWLTPGTVEPYHDPYGEGSYERGEGCVQVNLDLRLKTRGVNHSGVLFRLPFLEKLEVTADGRELACGWDFNWDETRRSGYWDLGVDRMGWTRGRVELCLILESPPRRVEIRYPWTDWVLEAEWEGAA